MKIVRSISLDFDLVVELKSKGVVLSTIVNEFLREYLKLPKEEESAEGDELDSEVTKLRAKLADKEVLLNKRKKERQKKKLKELVIKL